MDLSCIDDANLERLGLLIADELKARRMQGVQSAGLRLLESPKTPVSTIVEPTDMVTWDPAKSSNTTNTKYIPYLHWARILDLSANWMNLGKSPSLRAKNIPGRYFKAHTVHQFEKSNPTLILTVATPHDVENAGLAKIYEVFQDGPVTQQNLLWQSPCIHDALTRPWQAMARFIMEYRKNVK